VSEHVTRSEAETVALGRNLGRRLAAGRVVLLSGPLGAGKTAFVRGMAEGLACDLDEVSSPTFTIVQQYNGPVPLQHVDLYRLAPHEVDDLALEDLLEGAVMAVEWPDRWHRAPAGAITVTITPAGETERRITIRRAPPPDGAPDRAAGAPDL
jgi:tRNA threonylcarbamoyladenosine biosynthesis protein TsaE